MKLHQTMISAQFGTLSRWQYSHNNTNTSQSGPMGVFAVHIVKPDDTEEINYIHKDHLGSWNTITDESGSRIQELSFDAWGNRRDPATWRAFADAPPEPLFDRGFTGHEHLDEFGLINMNGRVYDPLVSRMLSPDNFIQAPGYSQSLNRYSYCWNNPLKYTDPSGQELGVENRNNWFWWEYRGGSNSSHSIGPGSGNHWSDQYRSEYGNFMLMNQRSFDNKYGDGAYLKGIELNKSSNIFNSLWKSGNIGVNSKVFLVKTTWLNFSGTTGNLNFDGLDYTYGVEIDNSAAANYGGQDGGGDRKELWGISFDLLVSAGISNMKNGFSLTFMRGNDDFGFSFTLYGRGDGYEAAASVNYLDIYSTNGSDMKIENTFGAGQTWSYGLLIGNYSRSGNGNSNTLTPSSYEIDGYGLSYGAPVAGSHYQTYTWGFTWSQIITYFK